MAAVALTSCLPPEGQRCASDRDCAFDELCSRADSCVPAERAVAVDLNWTIDGRAVNVTRIGGCAGGRSLSVAFADASGLVRLAFRPVTCELGRARFDRLPPEVTRLRVILWGADDAFLDAAEVNLQTGENTIDIDLET